MENIYTLLLKLEGPLQSWGYRSRFDHRDTALEPTRSGITGLLCSAMGISRDEDITIFDNITRMGVRVDRPGKLERDYHTALEVIKADGSRPDTVVSERDYLADASFTVGLESAKKDFLEIIAQAIQSPVWPLSLGRKSCPLSAHPIVEPQNPVKTGKLEDFLFIGEPGTRVVLENSDGERAQNDWPISFADRQFKQRRLQVTYIPVD